MARLYGPNVVDDGGGTPGGNTNIPASGSLSSISEDIRLILALKDIDADLNAAWTAFQNDRLDDMYAAIYRSNFYKNNTSTARQRRASQQTQPGAYKTQLDDWKLKTKKRLVQTGLRITTGIENMLETAYLTGMSDDQVDAAISKAGLIGQVGGTTGAAVNTLKSYARSFGVDSLYNDAYWQQSSKDLFDGTTTEEDIKATIRQLAATTYPAFADDLNAGKSLDAQASYITQTLSNLLERPVTINSPEAKRFLQYINPQTGKAEKPPQYLVEKEGKKLPGWDYTDNARASVDSLSLRVLKDMGMM